VAERKISPAVIRWACVYRSNSAIKRGDHIGMRAPGIIVPVRDRADRLPFERVAGILDW
jgi:hypothetical protein